MRVAALQPSQSAPLREVSEEHSLRQHERAREARDLGFGGVEARSHERPPRAAPRDELLLFAMRRPAVEEDFGSRLPLFVRSDRQESQAERSVCEHEGIHRTTQACL